jgi:hypothetical protein
VTTPLPGRQFPKQIWKAGIDASFTDPNIFRVQVSFSLDIFILHRFE